MPSALQTPGPTVDESSVLDQVARVLKGWATSTKWAASFRNRGTGGRAVEILNSAGAQIFSADNTGIKVSPDGVTAPQSIGQAAGSAKAFFFED